MKRQLLVKFKSDPSFNMSDSVYLIERLVNSYSLSKDNAVKLIQYALSANSQLLDEWMTDEFNDYTRLEEFIKNPESINRVRFQGKTKLIEISNPIMIDKLYKLICAEYIDGKLFQRIRSNDKKNGQSTGIKIIATQIFKELTQTENISEWKSCCIIGLIFAHWGISIKEHIYTEDEYNIYKKTRYRPEPYLAYLSGIIKRYIIK